MASRSRAASRPAARSARAATGRADHAGARPSRYHRCAPGRDLTTMASVTRVTPTRDLPGDLRRNAAAFVAQARAVRWRLGSLALPGLLLIAVVALAPSPGCPGCRFMILMAQPWSITDGC